MVTGLLPCLGTQPGQQAMQLRRARTERCEPLAPQLLPTDNGALREKRMDGWTRAGASRWKACRGRDIPFYTAGDTVGVDLRYPCQVAHDIPHVPALAGTGLRPSIWRQGVEVLGESL